MTKADFTNPITGRGPIEGRPPGEVFAHQRWDEFFPKVGYVMTLGQIAPNQRFHPNFFPQHPNSVGPMAAATSITIPPPGSCRRP